LKISAAKCRFSDNQPTARAVSWEKRTKRDGLTPRAKPPQGASEKQEHIALLVLFN